MDLYQIISEIFGQVTEKVAQNIFNGTTQVFGSGFFHGVMVLSALFWLVMKIIKTEQFSIKDTYPITIFLLYFYSVYFITQNQAIYFETLNILHIPRDVLTYIFTNATGKHPAEVINSLYIALSNTQKVLDEADGAWYSFNIISKTLSIIFFLSSLILVGVLAFTIIFSTLLARIILSFGAFMFLCLLWSKTRGHFFSWLKLYWSISFYAPFGALLGSVGVAFGDYASNSATKMGADGSMDLFGMVIVIIGMWIVIFLFTKIPMIINAIVGTANDSSTGGTGLVGMVAGFAGASLSKIADYFKGKGASGIGKLGDLVKSKFGSKESENKGSENPLDQDTKHS